MRNFSLACLVLLGLFTSTSAQTAQETWPPSGVFMPGQPGVSLPVAVSQPQPGYTREAMRARVQGIVILSVVIQADGSVGPVKVLRSLDPGLDQNAMEAAKRWKFRPATKDGTPVPFLVSLQMTFRLSDGPLPQPPTSAPFTWPDGFSPDLDNSVPGPGWTDDVEETATVRLRVSFPSIWTLKKGTSSNEWLTLLAKEGSGIFVLGIARPIQAPFPLSPLPQTVLDQMGPGLSRLPGLTNTTIHKVGQTKSGNQFWLWLDLSRSIDPSTAPPEAQQLIDFTGTELHGVSFITSAGTESVMVIGTLIVPKTMSPEDANAEFRKAGADVIAVVSRMKIEAR